MREEKQRKEPEGFAVQMKLGEAAIAAIRDFASSEIESIEELEKGRFAHVRDSDLRKSLAETLFGARWLYHLGLVTLATDVHRAAHVRAQIIDYAAICEAVLLDALTHGIFHGHFSGDKWQSQCKGGHWSPADPWPKGRAEIGATIRKRRNFWWSIEVAADEKIIKPAHKAEIHGLRERRNQVHIAELAAVSPAGIRVSKNAYQVMHRCVDDVAHWFALHPAATR